MAQAPNTSLGDFVEICVDGRFSRPAGFRPGRWRVEHVYRDGRIMVRDVNLRPNNAIGHVVISWVRCRSLAG